MFVWGAHAASRAGFGALAETIFRLTTRFVPRSRGLRGARRMHTDGLAGLKSLNRQLQPSANVNHEWTPMNTKLVCRWLARHLIKILLIDAGVLPRTNGSEIIFLYL